jgi:hypothetical protein
VIGALADEVGRFPQNPAALLRRYRAPLDEAGLRGFERAIEVFRIRMRQVAERFAGSRAYDGLGLAAAALQPLTADEELQLRVGSGLGNGRVARALSLIGCHREVSWVTPAAGGRPASKKGGARILRFGRAAHLACFSKASKSSSGVR